MPRDIATREIFKVCIQEGLSVQAGRMCVYLDVTHLPREHVGPQAGRHPGDLREVPRGRSAQGADEDLPRASTTRWAACGSTTSANGDGGLDIGSPRNQQTNIPGLFAIGECDYQYHGANRLGANSLVACIFSGLMVAPGIVNYVEQLQGPEGRRAAFGLFDQAAAEAPGALRRRC